MDRREGAALLAGATSRRRGSCWRPVAAPLGLIPRTTAPPTRRPGRSRSERARILSTPDNPGGAAFAVIGDDRQTIAARLGLVLAFEPSGNP
ncbi:MAG: hypothetical protein AVDCRST_MAG88-336 [uncultured Thermomicrobiales bacterium]|uniref:Uncharacterized protein n=1 Tax=uncultured Thermomicrobiales bacterium TaxID=1645740 RepID=A0A6J4UAF7_9BACT|nr:MAG: hypothetical protein AVDCRST_MAG88-336 [uncultured Thermomicrobiales bacterium]